MAQIFSGDAQTLPVATALVLLAETQGPITNFLTIPFQNAKGFGSGTAFVQPGTATSAIVLRIRRNPNAENLVVATITVSGDFAPGLTAFFTIPFVDPIPDNRSVQYAFTIQAVGATGNGVIGAGSAIFAMMLSG